jgi:hypothetical protein
MQFHRHMGAGSFIKELDKLRAYRSSANIRLLQTLEMERMLFPRLRLRYPDAAARRFWLHDHEHWGSRQMVRAVEPDGGTWDAAVDLHNALHKWNNSLAYGLTANPLDDLELRFAEFVQIPSATTFEAWENMRVDVSNDVETQLFDDRNVEHYYTIWQVLLAAELADAGVHMLINFGDSETFQQVHEALGESRVPDGARYSYNLMPARVMRDFGLHERALDAVVWFAEEQFRSLCEITKTKGGRYRLTDAEAAKYEQDSQVLSTQSAARFGIGVDDLVAAIKFLAGRWSDWKREGRPLIADAYQKFAGKTVVLARRLGATTFGELRDQVGRIGGWHKPMLDVMWPDWAEQEKERVRLTLKGALKNRQLLGITEVDVSAFVDFLAREGQEAFFWRLNSFENHALRGNEFAIEGMKSDIAGMAICVEHIATALGATALQLDMKFKQLWRDPGIQRLLKRNDVAELARKPSLLQNWPALKAEFDKLRMEPGGKIAAELAMAYRIRGGVHQMLPENDHLELESLFTGLMCAAVLTFVEVRSKAAPSLPLIGVAPASVPQSETAGP